MRLFGEVTDDGEAGCFVTTFNIIVRLSQHLNGDGKIEVRRDDCPQF